ncbi:hypothetical protein RFI_23725 [Reticulomyxa filosa]|uniref:Rho-GAP domain-containing protein n=1 Tax=Reticulomyxa filosa TaxID=46433 RepID=X6MKN5_RETFI|nr:hypothetical protein RFI_23725 [Reticulomyxa filosa]|eukprot:ETO13645.1 hypothetical protein RFI_23725 [Reticulomyxa filosa]
MTVFNKLLTKQKQIQNDKKLTILQSDILISIQKLDPQQELEKFVHFCVEKHGKYEPVEEQKTSLDLGYRDVFLSIEDAMAVTKEINTNANIPYIVPLLCNKVKELDGFRTEGIFRKSASVVDVRKLRNKVNNNLFIQVVVTLNICIPFFFLNNIVTSERLYF